MFARFYELSVQSTRYTHLPRHLYNLETKSLLPPTALSAQPVSENLLGVYKMAPQPEVSNADLSLSVRKSPNTS